MQLAGKVVLEHAGQEVDGLVLRYTRKNIREQSSNQC